MTNYKYILDDVLENPEYFQQYSDYIADIRWEAIQEKERYPFLNNPYNEREVENFYGLVYAKHQLEK